MKYHGNDKNTSIISSQEYMNVIIYYNIVNFITRREKVFFFLETQIFSDLKPTQLAGPKEVSYSSTRS